MSQPSDVADAVRAFYDAFAARDIDAIERMTSEDEGAVAIGTDPDEWWTGGQRIMDAIREQLSSGEVSIKPGDPQIGQADDVAWFADQPAFVLPGGEAIPCRLTGVLRREAGEWKVVQSHCSIGVANAEAFGP